MDTWVIMVGFIFVFFLITKDNMFGFLLRLCIRKDVLLVLFVGIHIRKVKIIRFIIWF